MELRGRPIRASQIEADALDRDDQVVEHAGHGLRRKLLRHGGRRRRRVLDGGGGRPWAGAMPGAGKIGAESDAVAPAESEAVTPGDEAAAVVELTGSGGGGGIGGGEDMVETRVSDTKLVGLGFLPTLLLRL